MLKDDDADTYDENIKLFDFAGFVTLISDKAFMSWSIGLSVFILGYFVPFVHLVSIVLFVLFCVCLNPICAELFCTFKTGGKLQEHPPQKKIISHRHIFDDITTINADVIKWTRVPTIFQKGVLRQQISKTRKIINISLLFLNLSC